MMEEFQNWLNEKETQEWLAEQIDAIADRQMNRLYGSIGGQLHGSKGGFGGAFDTKNIIAQVVASFLAQRFNMPNANNSSGTNPYKL